MDSQESLRLSLILLVPCGGMQHIEFIRVKASKQLVALRNEVKSHKRLKKTTINSVGESSAPYIREIREDTILIKGSFRKIRRLFVTSGDSGKYGSLGWVLSSDIDCCMVCLTALDKSIKHHCRACGNVACGQCSENKAVVLDIHSVGPVRVCKQCYWGQVGANR